MSIRHHSSRIAHRFHAKHAAARRASNGQRGHRHLTILAPQPWGAIEMPVTFSRSMYERQHDWFYQRTGVGMSTGGPLNRWCQCPAPDGRPHRRRGARPYWQIELDEQTAAALRAANEIEEKRRLAAYERHLPLHAGDFLALINCHDEEHRSAGA